MNLETQFLGRNRFATNHRLSSYCIYISLLPYARRFHESLTTRTSDASLFRYEYRVYGIFNKNFTRQIYSYRKYNSRFTIQPFLRYLLVNRFKLAARTG